MTRSPGSNRGWPQRVEHAVAELLAAGEATISTSRGLIQAQLERPGRIRPGSLRVRRHGDNGVGGSSEGRLHGQDEPGLHHESTFYLTGAVIELVGG